MLRIGHRGARDYAPENTLTSSLKTALDMKANYLLALYKFTHTANVEKAHESGLKVVVQTINKPEEAEEYAKKGVDGIASDKPDILKAL